ncbi:hypothetical protein EON79_12220 [bacterium]|nr:MAG: hypothetical protein EON79_12220 [bacterium]
MYKVDASKKTGDATNFLLGIYQDGKKQDEQMWSVTPKGIFQNSLGPTRRPFNPPQPVVIFPLKEGEPFKWSGTSQAVNGKRASSQLEGSVIGMQTVDTAMGNADAVMIESVSTFDVPNPRGPAGKGQTVTDSWFRPGVGIVRYRQVSQAAAGALSYTLRSYTPRGGRPRGAPRSSPGRRGARRRFASYQLIL